jgi:plastocyanin
MRKYTSLLIAAVLCGALSACQADNPLGPAPDAPDHALWNITVNHRAILMSTVAPYDTVRLVSTALDAEGRAITDAPPATFTTTSQAITIGPDGLVTALTPAFGVTVVAKLSYHNTTSSDTIVINITNNPAPPKVTTYSLTPAAYDMSPLPKDSAVMYAGILSPYDTQLQVTVLDDHDTPIPNVIMRYTSSDTARLLVDAHSGYAYKWLNQRPGKVTMTAESTIYGVAVRDTLVITIKDALDWFVNVVVSQPAGSTTPSVRFQPDSLVLLPGGGVRFSNFTTVAVDVTFDDPGAAVVWPMIPSGSGNIEAWKGGFKGRAFMEPGVYTFHSTLYGATGKIVVLPPE